MQASSIKNALLNEAYKKGIKILNDTCVIDVKKNNDKFEVITNNNVFYCDKLIIATGSNAYYKEESLGYNICKNFGHNIIKVLPSLVQLVGNEKYFKAGRKSHKNLRSKSQNHKKKSNIEIYIFMKFI